MPIPGENDYALDNFRFYEDEKSTPKAQDMEKNYRDLVGESSDTRDHIKNSLSGRTSHDGLLGSELSSSLREIRFSDQEFATSTSVPNIKYNHLRSQNNNPFYFFHN